MDKATEELFTVENYRKAKEYLESINVKIEGLSGYEIVLTAEYRRKKEIDMPYDKIKSGKNKGKYRSKKSGRVVTKEQMVKIHIKKAKKK